MSDNENQIVPMEEVNFSPKELKELVAKAANYDKLKTKYVKMMNKLENVSEQRKAWGEHLKDLAIHVVGSKVNKDVSRAGWASSLPSAKAHFQANPQK